METHCVAVDEFINKARNLGYSVIQTGIYGWLARKANSWIFADKAHLTPSEISSFHVFSLIKKELDGVRLYDWDEIENFINLHNVQTQTTTRTTKVR